MKWNEIEGLLPGVLQRGVLAGSPLRALLEVMEELHAPDEELLLEVPDYFDPYTAPDELVPMLAEWVDLGWLLGSSGTGAEADGIPPLASGMGRLRELVAAAPCLASWRGTARGLVRFLETATGVSGFEVNDQVVESGQVRPFHMLVRAPAAAKTYEALVQLIVETEKPAYMTHEIAFG